MSLRSLSDLKGVELKDAFTFFFLHGRLGEHEKTRSILLRGSGASERRFSSFRDVIRKKKKKRTLCCIEGNVASFLSPRFLLEKQSEPLLVEVEP